MSKSSDFCALCGELVYNFTTHQCAEPSPTPGGPKWKGWDGTIATNSTNGEAQQPAPTPAARELADRIIVMAQHSGLAADQCAILDRASQIIEQSTAGLRAELIAAAATINALRLRQNALVGQRDEYKDIVDWVVKKCEAYPKIAFPVGRDLILPLIQQIQCAMHQTFDKAGSSDTWYRIASEQQDRADKAESEARELRARLLDQGFEGEVMMCRICEQMYPVHNPDCVVGECDPATRWLGGMGPVPNTAVDGSSKEKRAGKEGK